MNIKFFTVVMVFLSFNTGNATIVAKEIDIAQNYLNNIRTFTSDFIQTDANNNISTGQLFIDKPGRLKWQYNTPTPITILLKDGDVTYYDKELDELSKARSKKTAFDFLLTPNINLHKNYTIQNLVKDNNQFAFDIITAEDQEIAKITLQFYYQPLRITKLIVTDLQNNITAVKIFAININLPIDSKNFIINRNFFNKR